MNFTLHQLSVQGGRDNNEDRIGYSASAEAVLLVLADGMGGYNLGEVAAEVSVRVFTQAFAEQAQPLLADPAHFLQHTLVRANRAIVDHARTSAMPELPRTTLVAAVIQHNQIWSVHTGDSRLYRLRRNAPLLRTRDHSYQDKPELMPHAATVPNRNLLFACLGCETAPIFDHSGPSPLQPGDRVLLCSDGLWSMVDDFELELVLEHAGLDEALSVLVALALQRAGAQSDNISALVLGWRLPADNAEPGANSAHRAAPALPQAVSGLPAVLAAAATLEAERAQRALNEIQAALERTAPHRPTRGE